MINSLNNLGPDIQKLINRLGLHDKFQLFCLQNCWKDIVGDFLAAHSLPQKLFDSQLTIHTDNAGISTEMFFLKDKIIEKIAKQNGITVKKIFSRVGSIRLNFGKESIISDENEQLKEIELSDEDIVFVALFGKNFVNTPVYEWARKIAINYAKDRRMKIKSGWLRCEKCGSLVAKGRICNTCGISERILLRRKLREILLNKPWIGYNEIRCKLVISKSTYEKERKLLICDLQDRKKSRADIERLLMLSKSLKREDITSEMIYSMEKQYFKR